MNLIIQNNFSEISQAKFLVILQLETLKCNYIVIFTSTL